MSVSVDTKAARAGLAMLHAGILQAAGLALQAGIKAAEGSAKSTHRWKDKTGGTRASIRGERTSYDRGFVMAGGAARLLESGTRAHIIQGRPTLRFVVNGQVVFARMVHHPGTAARPFMAEARMVGEQAIDYAAEYFVNEAIQRSR